MVLCQLDELGLSCFGCCTCRIENKKKTYEDIQKNTLQLAEYGDIATFSRRARGVRLSGICYSLVFHKNRIVCGAHPALNVDDYRDEECMTEYICKTLYHFRVWDPETRQRFLQYIAKQKYDHYNYSLAVKDGELLEEFLRSEY